MRYELKNLGPGNYYCVDSGKLRSAGESTHINRLDEGTWRLGQNGPHRRLEITDRRHMPSPPPPANTAEVPAAPVSLPTAVKPLVERAQDPEPPAAASRD